MAAPIPLWPAGAPGRDTAEPAFEPTLTPYPVATGRPTGAVIVCPGGGYGGRAAHEGRPIAEAFVRHGLTAFVLDYRVAPYRHPYPLLDAQRAVRWVRARAAEYAVDPARVAILGFSAGGHLAATATTHWDRGQPTAEDPLDRPSCRPDAAILCYPVISLGQWSHGGSRQNLLGPQPDPALVEDLSNELRVTAETPPCFLWHTAADGGVPVQNSLLFARALADHKVPFELHVFERGGHGLGLAGNDPRVATWLWLAATWLTERGWAGGEAPPPR